MLKYGLGTECCRFRGMQQSLQATDVTTVCILGSATTTFTVPTAITTTSALHITSTTPFSTIP